jgi:hypothetical protein
LENWKKPPFSIQQAALPYILRPTFDGVLEILAGLAQDQPACRGGIVLGMDPELAQRGIGLAAASGATIDDDVGGALDEGELRARLAERSRLRPPDRS